MRDAVIVSAVRTPVGKGVKGSLSHVRPDTLAALCIQEALKRGKVSTEDVEDVILGCAMPEAEQGMNVARMVSLQAGLPDTACGMTVNRYCSSGLQTISMATDKIRLGDAEVVIAGGLESMSMIPFGGHKIAPNPDLTRKKPEAYLTMGLTAEKVSEKYSVSREDQDKYSLQSHQRATHAIKESLFSPELLPIRWTEKVIGVDGEEKSVEREFTVDEGPREDTSLEALRALKPAFKLNGTVTAGNSSQVSDGAAAVVVTSRDYAEKNRLKPMARLVRYAVAGLAPEIMGMGPALAIPKVLEKAGMKLSQIDLFEINEAFASQTVAVLRELGLSEDKVNVNGGAIALGHPLGCTGTKLTVQLIYELKRRGGKYGIVSMCVGGGMGAAGIFEML